MITFDSYSFGCRVNQAEKEALDRELLKKGYLKSEDNPDVYIINTCAVTHKAEREAKQHIYQIRKKYPQIKIVVTGCAATNWTKTKKKVKEIDYLVDNPSKEYIAELIETQVGKSANKRANDANSAQIHDKFVDSGRYIVKIQDGCNRFCSFCIVPYLRGLPKSTTTIELIDRVNSYTDAKEVILTAINTDAYGADINENFTDLVRAILEKTQVPRFSFGSIHPWSINDDFLKLYTEYKDSKRFVHFFHIPLQSGSNNTLRLMKRSYTREEFIEKLHKLAEINPMVFIGTDVIVGFLDESDRDFEDTYTFLESTPISKMHVFRFSVRDHTAAYYLKKRLSEPSIATKNKRSEALRDLSDKKYHQFLEKHVGKTIEALFMEKREGDFQLALLENQIPAYIKTEKDLKTQILPVKIESLKKDELIGKLL